MSRASFLAVLLWLLVTSRLGVAAEDNAVVWTDLVNTTVIGAVLQKTSGGDGGEDAGAVSTQALTAGDGYIEFTAGEATTRWVAGLSHSHDGTSLADIDFAFRSNGAPNRRGSLYRPSGRRTFAATTWC